jgi:hypothetical protein
MEILINNLEEEIINKDQIYEYKNQITIDLIKHLYYKNCTESVNTLLKIIKNNEIIYFFMKNPNLELYIDSLFKYHKLTFFKWIDFSIKNIHENNYSCILNNYNKFYYKLNKIDYAYINLKLDKNFNILKYINSSIKTDLIIDLCIKKNNINLFQSIIKKNKNFKVNQLLINNINLPILQINILINYIIKNNIIFNCYELIDLFSCIIINDKFQLFKIFHDFYIDKIEYKIFYYKQIVKDLINFNKFKFILYLLSKESMHFGILKKYLNNYTNKIYSIECFEFLKLIIPLKMNENIFWNILSHCDNKLEFLNKNYDIIKDISSITNQISFFNENKDCNILNYFEQKIPKIFINDIYIILSNNYNLNIIHWFFINYKNELLLTENLLYNILNNDNLDLFKIYEQHFNFTIDYYDYIMHYVCKYGLKNIIKYIENLYSDRYILKLNDYLFNEDELKFELFYKLTINLIKNTIHINELNDCIICYENKKKMLKTNCNHIFCDSCINQWINNIESNNCPYCRQDIIHFSRLIQN